MSGDFSPQDDYKFLEQLASCHKMYLSMILLMNKMLNSFPKYLCFLMGKALLGRLTIISQYLVIICIYKILIIPANTFY